ncbi:MAG: hypothetical protein ACLQMS_07510, partial [Desulfomonilaceae bacterium]
IGQTPRRHRKASLNDQLRISESYKLKGEMVLHHLPLINHATSSLYTSQVSLTQFRVQRNRGRPKEMRNRAAAMH